MLSESRFKKRLLVLAIAQSLLPPLSHAATLTVNAASDDGSSGCELREAILTINEGTDQSNGCINSGSEFGSNDTIEINSAALSSPTITMDTTSSALLITSDVTINGQDITIDASLNNSRVFEISDATVSFNNLTVSGGMANYGGGIYASNSTVTLTSSTLSGNSATNYGGAIGASYSSVTLTSSTLSGNSANYGGAIDAYGSSVTLTNSTLSGNSATYGGAISAYDSSVTLTNSTLSGNTTTDLGGAIRASYDSSVTLTSSTLSGNSATNYGGAIDVYNSSVTLTNSTLSGNTATYGGAISAYDSSVMLTNSTLSGNTANNRGGAIDAYYYSNISLLNSILANSNRPDCYLGNSSTLINLGGNLVEDDFNNCGGFSIENEDPKLGPLQNNGGITETHALQSDSLAINAAVSTGCPSKDQRGEPRDSGFFVVIATANNNAVVVDLGEGQCDIGSIEYSIDDG